MLLVLGGLGKASWDFDGHCHRDLQRTGVRERDTGRRQIEEGSSSCAVLMRVPRWPNKDGLSMTVALF